MLVDRLESVPPSTDGAPLVIGATLEMMSLRSAGRQEAVSYWPERCGLSPEALPPLEVGSRVWGRNATEGGITFGGSVVVVNGVSYGMGSGCCICGCAESRGIDHGSMLEMSSCRLVIAVCFSCQIVAGRLLLRRRES